MLIVVLSGADVAVDPARQHDQSARCLRRGPRVIQRRNASRLPFKITACNQRRQLTVAVFVTTEIHIARAGAAVVGRFDPQIRTDDVFVEKGQRALMARLAEADLFVSIHFNAAGNPNARGTETYVLTPARQRSTGDASSPIAELGTETGNATDAWNVVLGEEVHRALIDRLGTVDRGLKRARFAVLRLAEMPAILIGAGFLSHEEEAREIASPTRRGEIAEAMSNGIVAYSNQVQAFHSSP